MALARSLNTVTVRLVDAIGIGEIVRYLPRFGLSGALPRNLSIALGSDEVTPLEMVRAYGVFATLGKRFEPIFITRVTDLNGNPLDFGGTRPALRARAVPSTAFVVTSMMQTVVQRGHGTEGARARPPVAGKTGRPNDTHDAVVHRLHPGPARGRLGRLRHRALARPEADRAAAPRLRSGRSS
jgi:penicillin-binding protein 1A